MSTPLWLNADAGAPAYDAQTLRRLFSMFIAQLGTGARFGARQGVHPADQDAVSLLGTTITVLDTKAVLYPGITASSGPYVCAIPSTSFSLAPADPTNPRKDIVILRVYDDDEDSSGLREAVAEYIVGTPAAAPVEPTVPTGGMRVATIDVPQSGTGSASLTYNAPYTVATGGVLPIRNQSERPVGGGGPAGGVLWNLERNWFEVIEGGSWKVRAPLFAARSYDASGTNIPTGSWTPVLFDTPNADWGSGSFFTVPAQMSGKWTLSAFVGWDTNPNGMRAGILTRNGTDKSVNLLESTEGFIPAVTGFPTGLSIPAQTFDLVAGDTIHLLAWQNSGGTLGTNTAGGVKCMLNAVYLGQ